MIGCVILLYCAPKMFVLVSDLSTVILLTTYPCSMCGSDMLMGAWMEKVQS